MTYDYSLGYLQRNAEMVAKLIRVANTGEVLAVDFDDWAKLRYYQQQVHSLLANISKNVQDYADIRQKVRCWTEHMPDGAMRLNVGLPKHKVTGRPPGMAAEKWKAQYVPAEIAGGEYNHPGVIVGQEDFSKFVGMVIQAAPNIRLASARFDSLPDDPVEYFNDLFDSYGWRVKSAEDTRLTLVRV